MKVRFIFADGSTGAEVLRYDQVATFKGTWNAFGGSEDQALASVANGVVKGLVKQIQQNR